MNHETANILNQINACFYEENAASFSQTRNAPWEGWRRCVDACKLEPDTKASVLDVACGNLRFATFLAEEYPAIDWHFFAVDNCEPLAHANPVIANSVNFTCEDIVTNILKNLPPFEPANTSELAQNAPFDIVASFGFMHHIPSFDLRIKFLKHALNYVRPNGHLIVSFWQFMNDESKREKIEQTHTEALKFYSLEVTENDLERKAEGLHDTAEPRPVVMPDALDPGDYFLGWKNLSGQYRYCHHFTDEEIDRLIGQLSGYATPVDSFTADGKTGDQNRYVVLRRSGWPSGYFESIEPLDISCPADLPPDPVSALD